MAQKNYNYDTAWKKVEAFQQKGLPKSALEVVNRIYAEAKTNKQEAQQIKALVYQSQLTMQVGEDTWQKNIAGFEQEAAAASEPVKQILNGLTADLYYSYFQQQRYQIYQRTNTADFKKDDPATWTITDFHTKITTLYEASLQHPKLLQTGLEKYDPIIIKGNMRKLRPTLFDLLAWKALNYFRTDERDITQPVYAFKITDMAALAAAPIFIRYEYSGKDSSNHNLLTLQTFQQLLAFHRNDADKAAFVDADIQRVAWVHSKAVMPGKEQLYKELLEQIYETNNNLPEAAQAGYLLAQWYHYKGSQYNAGTGNPEDRDLMVQAVRLLKEIIARFPESEGGINAGNLLKEITRATLNLQIEKVNIPEQPFRVLVQFKNFSNLNLRLIRLTDEVENAMTGNDMYNGGDKYWQKLVSLSPMKTWQQNIPAIGDYRQHSAEIKVDALPVGRYILLTSVDGNFSLNHNPLAAATFYVSNISYVLQEADCFVLNRNDGQPLPGAKVQVSYKYYDYNSRKYKTSNPKSVTTDKNGYIKIPASDNPENRYNSQVQLDFNYGNDRLKMDEGNNVYYRDEDFNAAKMTAAIYEKQNLRWFIFTDRSIYRPGQLVYFKAIGVTKDYTTRQSKVYQPGKKITVELQDVNNQKAGSLQLDVNEYGSMTGTFRLPQTGLTGNFTIQVDESRQNISVEEYKRPKFFVEYEKLKTSFRLNEEITVTGNAKAYAGNNVDGATVSYRVYRNTRWLYPWLFWRRGIWPPQGESRTEIINGEVKTDADGKFKIAFNAQPDLSLDQSLDPTFDYTIEADVTDVSGETRSGTTTVSVGYKSLQLSLGLQDGQPMAVDSLKKMAITATNLAGEKQTVKTVIKIYELITPNRLLHSRYWTAPDTTVMDEATFRQYFPNDPYRTENDYRTWKRGNTVLEDTFTTSSPNYQLKNNANLKSGWYAIEASATDKDGHTVTTLNYVLLYDTKSGKLPSAHYAFEDATKTVVEPGEKAMIYVGTSADNVFVVQQTLKADKGNEAKPTSLFQFLKLSNELQKTEFAATEADRGGYTVNRFYVKTNRLYTQSWNISVPWANKEMDISYETFRDKLLPGQEEKWKVKIKGYKGEKVAAEMLVSMYDASLDQFKPHYWSKPGIWPTNYFGSVWNGENNFNDISASQKSWYEEGKYYEKRYDALLSANMYGGGFSSSGNLRIRGNRSMSADMVVTGMARQAPAPAGAVQEGDDFNTFRGNEFNKVAKPSLRRELKFAEKETDKDGEQDQFDQQSPPDLSSVSVRTNLQETAFFFPDLHTDADGNIEFSFTMPEALTQWKLQTLAHTKALAFGMDSRTTVTQKDLMVQPNAPRFFREGDRMELSAKISNLTDKELTGQAQLLLFNTATNQPVDGWFKNVFPNQYFTVAAGQSVAVKFPMEVPYHYGSALTYRIVAKAGNVSDGEESAAPVLTNRMLVTESFPLNIRNAAEKTFTWQKLLTSNSTVTGKGESTLTNQSLTVEFTTNPTWYAVQALPYLMEYPYECSEQNWNRLYANALASRIANSTPTIRSIFEKWKTIDTAALLSNLEKNPELKQALLEETPWVMDAQNESKQKRNIALLFDMVRLSNEATKSLSKLKEAQSPNGGFVWFKGGPDDRYITQYIVSGIGHLRKLGALPQNGKAPEDGKSLTQNQQSDILAIASRAMPYLDARLKDEYDNLIRYKANLKLDNLSSIAIQYLYAKSFFPEWQTAAASKTAVAYYTSQAKQYWLSRGRYEQGMIALALYRGGDAAIPAAIIKSLKENSISNEEFGMYWKEFNTGGYYWYQSPIESHALLIEAFTEIDKNTAIVNDLKTWLLKQKQTQNWRTTKATAEACYALLMQGTNWLNTEQEVTIKLGNTTLSSNDEKRNTEAGSGYFKQKIEGGKVNAAMGTIHVKLKATTMPLRNPPFEGDPVASWGAVYWQYFENLDKITFAATPLQLTKKLFIQKNTDRGPVLTPIADNSELKVGDKVKVRIELRVDRNMEYVHMKDMRAACLEPVNVLSQYKYQDGLGYYESTRDASTSFFFNYLNKGTYVFEYPLTVTHSGNFSNGITTIQCMYAPEFTSHSEGIRIQVAINQ